MQQFIGGQRRFAEMRGESADNSQSISVKSRGSLRVFERF